MTRRRARHTTRRERLREHTPAAARRLSTDPHVPNTIPLGQRLMQGALALTWTAWALVGLLCGHMYLVVSRRGAIHFSGVPALIFCAAVLASAAACAIDILDHHDRRDNEAAYSRWKSRLWWAALTAFGLACALGLARHLGQLSWGDDGLGLLPVRELQGLLVSDTLSGWLQPHAAWLRTAGLWSTLWCVGGVMVLKLFGQLKPHPQASLAVTAFMLFGLMLPPLAAFTLMLLADLVASPIGTAPGLDEDAIRSRVAWAHSMLVACLGAWLFLLGVAVVLLQRLAARRSKPA